MEKRSVDHEYEEALSLLSHMVIEDSKEGVEECGRRVMFLSDHNGLKYKITTPCRHVETWCLYAASNEGADWRYLKVTKSSNKAKELVNDLINRAFNG